MTDLDDSKRAIPAMATRFRGFLPVVIDVETGGFNPATDALLEIAAVLIDFNDQGALETRETVAYHVQPFAGANLEASSLEINGIDPYHPLRPALPEREALARIFREVRAMLKTTGCKRAVLVGHNAHFDLGFLNAAIARSGIKRSPFHAFSCFDTATLAGVALGQTVLKRAVLAAGLPWDNEAAHSARYDTEQTARLFCTIVNRFKPIFDSAGPAPQTF
jgi:ribonuclease T